MLFRSTTTQFLSVTGVATAATLGVTGVTTTQFLSVTGVATAATLGVTGVTTTQFLNVTGVGTIATLGVTGVTTSQFLNVTGVGTIATLGVTGVTTSQFLNVTGVGTITTLSGTTATYTTGNFTNGNIVTGVVTTLTSTNATLTNINSSGISTLGVTSVTNLTSQNINNSGIITTNSLNIGATQVISSGRQLQNIASLDATTTSTIESAIANAPNDFTSLNVSGISTLQTTTLIGGGTSTGTAGQVLQVTGISSSVYIGGNLGVGNTNPISKFQINTGSNSFVVQSDGRVAIGTTGFAQSQDLDGTLLVKRDTGLARIRIRNDSGANGTYSSLNLKTPNSDWSVYVAGDTNEFRIFDVGQGFARIHIDGSGNVGINSTSPTSRLDVVGDGKVSGVVTATTFIGQINSGVGTITTLTGTNATLTNINSSGISTLGITSTTNLTAQQLNVSGITTTALLNVGVGGTIITTTNGPRVGINSTSPTKTLDVGGTINSSTDVQIGGVSVLTSASNDAVALAIALG